MVVMEFTKGEMVGVGGVVKCEGWRSVRESKKENWRNSEGLKK